ncbi:lipocalin family protein [Leucobacter tenebrionis]|uniref:lipocalin family protein n=1 Tax=Leucobacter tenebrionis TaxID=2873270 RepID=UPI001CA71965|nr:lipocalin family protein [Leucobacter tenebrionis]QZY51830.1 lipocalin family protein [Leucobacter tenebrionis]
MSDQDRQVRSVEDLDLQRYLGLWYEIGRLPLRFEDDGARDVTAEYSLRDDGTVQVDNRCIDAEGEPTQALGQAEPDEDHAGRLRVSFLPEGLRWIPFTRADYWVLHIDEGYRHALVGTPDRKHLWLLAREPHIDAEAEREFLAEAREQGYDLTHWIRPQQSGARVTDEQLSHGAAE